MERRTELGVYYSRAGLQEDCYPLNFHFFSEGSERKAKIEDRPVTVLGFVTPCYDSAPGSNMIVVYEGTEHVASISTNRISYDCPPISKTSMIEGLPDFLPKEMKLPDKGLIYQQ